MHNLRFTVRNTDTIYSPLTEKYKVVDYVYPVDKYHKGNKIYIFSIHVLFGDAKEIDLFCAALRKKKQVRKFERDGNRISLLCVEEEKFYELLFDPELYFPRPVVIRNGIEEWDIAAWDRKKLADILAEMEKWPVKLQDFVLLGIGKENLQEIYFPRVLPKMPQQQRRAFRIAIKAGYYTFPRKVTLADLAKQMNISPQTYHEHLRRAEAKLLPFFARDISL